MDTSEVDGSGEGALRGRRKFCVGSVSVTVTDGDYIAGLRQARISSVMMKVAFPSSPPPSSTAHAFWFR